jgi:signal transduction histidine kinase
VAPASGRGGLFFAGNPLRSKGSVVQNRIKAGPAPDSSPARVLWPFIVVMAVLLALCIGGYRVMSSVRAFVGGESLWSKGHSVAVAQLRVYAVSGSPEAYRRFVDALEVPLGDREAREALDESPPDLERARAGFLRGGNHPEDVDGMVWLYRGFARTPLMRDAVAAWVEGDRLIAELNDVGRRLQQRLARPDPLDADEQRVLQARLDELDAELIGLEKRFSSSLGIASRDALGLLEWAVVLLTLVMGVVVVAYASRALRRHERARRQLAEAHQRWSLAASAAGIGVFEWRAGDDRYHIDQRGAALFGLQTGPEGVDVARRDWRDLLHADDLPAVRESVSRARGDGAVFRVRYRARLPGGEARHLESVGLLQQGADGQRTRVLGVVRDVSEEELRTRLDIEKTAAERVAKARMEFLSRLSHELRTPLNAVLGFAQLMQTDAGDPLSTLQAERMAHISAAGTHLLHLVNDVLDVTRIDAGHLPVQVVRTPLQPVLEAALRQVEPQRRALGITIDAGLPEPALCVVADPVRLEQVFVNLLTNGCKYNRPGGRLLVKQRAEGEQLWIDFQDQGEGLDGEEIDELFQPFKRLTRHWRVEGTGLGLVIVKLLLAQMGGGIDVASTRGEGSVFSVRLATCGE